MRGVSTCLLRSVGRTLRLPLSGHLIQPTLVHLDGLILFCQQGLQKTGETAKINSTADGVHVRASTQAHTHACCKDTPATHAQKPLHPIVTYRQRRVGDLGGGLHLLQSGIAVPTVLHGHGHGGRVLTSQLPTERHHSRHTRMKRATQSVTRARAPPARHKHWGWMATPTVPEKKRTRASGANTHLVSELG